MLNEVLSQRAKRPRTDLADATLCHAKFDGEVRKGKLLNKSKNNQLAPDLQQNAPGVSGLQAGEG